MADDNKYSLLSKIEYPEDLRKLKIDELPQVCEDLRSDIIDEVSMNPGHFASSLGVVEITVALHYVFNTPEDRLVWDVGHQAYGHKILTGRRESFCTNRKLHGIRPFPSPLESQYDTFACGHASNSISAALGMAVAAKIEGKNRHVVAIIGDGAMSGGLAFEGLNNVSSTNYRINEDSPTIDAEIEEFLYNALKEGNLLGEGTTLEIFIDRDNRAGGSIISSQKVGPSIADDIKTSAVWSVVLALIAIGLYILIRFNNIAFSIGATVALMVDTVLIIGAYSLCYGWMPFSLEIDQTFIGAILTAIGYSINDKVVIFDRVREFVGLYPKRDRTQLFNDSLNTTLARTINTSLSTLIVLLSIFILGGDSIRSFAFAMILGVVIGTLSSLFVAAPVAYLTMGHKMPKQVGEAE